MTRELLDLPTVVTAETALDRLEEYVVTKRAERNEAPEVPAMEWRPFRSLPRADNPHVLGP